MVRLLIAVLLFASVEAMADADVCVTLEPPPTACSLNQLTNGAVAEANKVMENFNTLGGAIDALPTPPSDCTTDQIIKWDGSAWACSDMSSSSTGVAWSRSYSRGELVAVQPAAETFDVLERVGGKCWERNSQVGYYSPDDDCQLWVMGVTDHRQCQVDMSASANPKVDELVVTPGENSIHFDRIHLLSGFGSVHIAINCPAQ